MVTVLNLISIGLKRYISALTGKPRFVERIILWGDCELSRSIEHIIEGEYLLGFCLTDRIRAGNPRPVTPEEIISICDKHGARILVTGENGRMPSKQKRRFQRYGIRIFQVEEFYQLLTEKFPVFNVNDGDIDSILPCKEAKASEIASRLIGIFGFLITLPLYPFIIAGIKLDSRGSAFFVQKRLGKDGKPFNFIKFRTMTEDPERERLNIDWMKAGIPKKERQDITFFGRFLRKYRIDEIPQFISLMKGDMNLIGPRPERPKAFEERTKMVPFYAKRLSIKPGITGWAQVHPFEVVSEKLQYDLFYINNHSLLLDMLIVLKTAWTMFRGNKE